MIPTVDLPGQWVANDHDALLADGVGGGEFVGIPQGWSTFAMVQRYAHLAPEHLAEHASRIEVGLKVTDLNHQKI
ncbi:hypothetical protein CKO27_22205 [Thiocystis violacea]|nr:hypothetical protein [Thiocystis violacea]